MSNVLTPSERFMYTFFGTLPSRIYYSYEKRCYVVRGQPGYYKNDLRRKKGKRYKVVPRWQYYLSKLSPISLVKSGFEFLSIGKALLLGGGFGDGDEEEDPESGGADPDEDGDADGDADDGNDNDKEPGLLSKGMNMGKDMFSPLLNFFGGSKDTNNDNNNENKDDSNDKKDENNDKKNEKKDDNSDKNDEKKDDKKDDKEGDKPEESTDYTGMVKDVLTSDTTKDAVKTGVSLFVPGGPAIVKAFETAEKLQSAGDKIDNVEDKIPKLK